MSNEKDVGFLANAFAIISVVFIILSAVIFKNQCMPEIILAVFAAAQFVISKIKKLSGFIRSAIMMLLADASIFLIWILGDNFYFICSIFYVVNTIIIFAVSTKIVVLQIAMVNIIFAAIMFMGYSYGIEEFVIQMLMINAEIIVILMCVINYEHNIAYVKEKTEEAQRANSFKGIFLANVSHEIRTPMNAILGMSELVLREDLSDKVRENTYSIQTSCMNLLSIINDILDFSKIDTGRMEIVEEEYEPMSVVNDVVNMIYSRLEDKDVRILIDIDPMIPQVLIGDIVRLKQVILNLMGNAVKFTEYGFITLKMSARKTEYGVNLKVSVKDTGIGIKPNDRDNLFTEFKAMDTHKKSGGSDGTGLGLIISKRIVELMHGFMNVESRYNAGSTFYFTIPQKVANETPSAMVKDKEKYKVLLFEPDIYQNKMLMQLFENLGVSCNLAEEEKEFLKELKNEEYTHLFIEYVTYNKYKNILSKLDESIQIICSHEINAVVKLEGNVKFLSKPIYALPVAAALNNETYTGAIQSSEKASLATFVAPDARILVVDDNEVNLKVAVGLLKPYRMQVDIAMSGKTAINMITANHYDVICLDHMMPGLDGIETTKIIRAMDGEYYKKIPIIALTANAVSGAREMFIESGMNDFISKPVEVRKFIGTIKKWIPREYIKKASEEDIISMQSSEHGADKVKMLENFGINTDDGILYCGTEENYLSILDEYARLGENKIKILDEALKDHDWKRYVIEVHALKSMSAQIGARKLSENAKELEMAGKSGSYDVIEFKHSALIGEYKKILEAAEPFRTETTPAEDDIKKEKITIDELKELVRELMAAVDGFDIEKAEAICARLKESDCSEADIDINEIDGLLNDFEYNGVHAAAERFLASVQG